jgi:hypothetical protein
MVKLISAGFQPGNQMNLRRRDGNPGNIASLEEINSLRKQSQDQRVVRFKELVKSGSTPNEAKKIVIEEFKLNRNPKAGTPVWMKRGKTELIEEGFDYQASTRGPENVGGVEKAAQKRKQVIGEGRKFEERIKRTKQKTGLGKVYELAHTANIFQAKKLGIDYPIDALAIQTQDVNNKVAEALNDELKPLYRKQLKLVNKLKRKSTEGLKNQLDKVNNDLLETVATGGKQGDVAANVLKPIIVNRDTLKGYIYTGAFDSSTELTATPGATTQATAAGSADDLFARANVESTLQNVRKQFENNTDNVCSIFGKANGGSVKACLTSFDDAVKKNPEGLFQKVINFSKSAGKAGKFGALAAVGAAGAGAVKTFMNDDPTTYLSNENQQKNMLIDMVTGSLDDTPVEEAPIGDAYLPTLGAVTVAGTAATAPSTIEAARSRRFGKTPSGITKTALKTVGRGLTAAATPLGLLATEPLYLAEQVQEGASLGEMATDPFNYLGPAFMGQASDFATKGLKSPGIASAMRLGISPSTLKTVSRRFGLPGLALSLGISGYETFDDYRNKRGFFSEE